MPEQINNPHDQFFRATFSRPDVAKSFLTNYLLPETIEKINLDSLEATQESFIDDDLKAHHSDLLLRFERNGGGRGFVYILLEHKSYKDARVGFQLLRYILRIWEKTSREKGGKMPPVLPIVLYHGKTKWKISRQFADLIEGAEDFAEFIPHFKYGLWDLSEFDANKIKSEIFLRAAVLVMQNVFDEDIAEKVGELWNLYNVKGEKETIEFIAMTVRYILSVNQYVSTNDIRKSLQKSLPKWEEEIMTPATREILQQGIERGSQMQTEKLVLQILQKKFGSLSENERTAVGKLSVKKLEVLALDSLDFNEQKDFDRWLERAV